MYGPGAPPYTGPTEIHYLFVDGASLHGRLKNLSAKYAGGESLDIDYKKLKGNFTKAFYYDAIPVRNDGEPEADYDARIKPMRTVLDAIAATDGMHVYEGDARQRSRRRGLEQKKVDVMLTVDMLTHAFRKNMHRATLLTGDNDFKPLIDALVQDGMFVTLWYPIGETSNELVHAADARRKLSIKELHSLLTLGSQIRLPIPHAENKHPGVQTDGFVAAWDDEGAELRLHKVLAGYVVTRQSDPLNRLHVTHPNIEMLREFCLESLDIEIPKLILARAAEIDQT